MKTVLSYLKDFKWQISLIVTLLLVQVSADLLLPRLMSRIVDEGILASDLKLVTSLGLSMLGLSFVVTASAIGVSYLISRLGSKASYTIRKDVFRKIEHFSLTEFETFSTSSLITRTTNDVMQVQTMFIMMFRMMITAPIYAIGGFFLVLSQSSAMSWIFAVLIPLLVMFILLVFRYAKPRFQRIQELVDSVNRIAREKLTGIRVIRAFNQQRTQVNKFEKQSGLLKDESLALQKVMVSIQPVFTLIMSFSTIIIIWVSSSYIQQGTLQVGAMMAFIQYTMQIMFSFIMLSFMFVFYPRAAVSAQRIEEVLLTEPSIQDPQNPQEFCEDCRGRIEFRHVSFKYPDAQENVLSDISFVANASETTAFIGSTGSGKSTLINLIPRFFDVSEGEILIDHTNIKDVTQHELRKRLGFIPQKGILFSGTIASNLRLANPIATDEEIDEAMEIAQAKIILEEKEDGLLSVITQGATNLSGGQKQRLSIARALVKKPEIFIFDDSFSALDYKTDAALRKAIKTNLKDATVLIVAQRISTIIDADRIIVLDNGQVVGNGTHKELMESCRVYQEIATSQLSQEELA